MKTRAIVQARMLSNRLRGKTLMSVAGKPLLYRIIDHVSQLPFIDEIVIATTTLDADKPIVSAAKDLDVKVYTGSSLNVLDRFTKAALDLDDDDIVVRFTADNPISIPSISSKLFEKAKSKDYVAINNLSHIVPEFIKVKALRKLQEITEDSRDLEHVTHFFRRKEGISIFETELLGDNFDGLNKDLDEFLTVDTRKDLVRMESLFSKVGEDMSLDNIYSTLQNDILPLAEGSLEVNLNGTLLGQKHPAYIIAEIGQNHNGSIDLAKKLVDMAKRCGVDSVKFQKRDIPSELTKEAFDRVYDNPNSFGTTYGEHRLFLELSEDEHREIKEYCDTINMTYFCTPCDIPSVELLERIGCPFFKVASRDLTNIPLLEKLGTVGKPVIISTGMASIDDIDMALKALNLPKNMVMITQCTSEYPCALENVNLKAMKTLRDKYEVSIGLSDHTSGVVVSTAAAVMGADLIEKHISLDRTMKGTDQPGSLEESGLRKLVDYIRATELAMGDGIKNVNPSTQAAKEKLARSITSNVKISKGEVLTEDMLCLKSPGTGLKWVEKDQLLGKIALTDIEADVTLKIEDFE